MKKWVCAVVFLLLLLLLPQNTEQSGQIAPSESELRLDSHKAQGEIEGLLHTYITCISA